MGRGMRKGQAAMEYLTTYGWAVLVIAIVLAAFIWLGVFNPKTPEWCSVPGMRCDNAQLLPTTQGQKLSVKLSNQLAERMQVCSLYCSAGPVGSNGLPLRNGAAITSAKAGGTGCRTYYSIAAFVFDPTTGLYTFPVSGVITISDIADTTPVVVSRGTTGTITVPGWSSGSTTITVPGGSGTEDAVVQTKGRRTAGLQGGIITDPGGITVSQTAYLTVVGPSTDPFLEIGQGITFVSNIPCLDEKGRYVNLTAGEKYKGKVFVEYVLRNDAKGTPARVLTGEVSTVLSAGTSS